MIDLQCDAATCVGPIDKRVVDWLETKYFPLDPDFITCMEGCHGGVPLLNSITIGGSRFRIARFLTLYDFKSKLTGPARPHFDYSVDERIIDSISFLVDGEHNTSRSLFSYIVPFATTRVNECLDRGYVDLFCFYKRKHSSLLSIVLWEACKAMDEGFRVEYLPSEEIFNADGAYENINWDSFLIPVASNFSEFAQLLYSEEDGYKE